ncbi:MAG: glycosyltransferase [Chloroflexota bacterium]|nr:glycosyltransferase [Chloroflexota bacterium]
MRAAIEQLVQEEEFDVVISGKQTLVALEPIWRSGTPLVADMCDATSVRIQRAARYAGPLRLPFLILEYAQTRHAERELMRRADHAMFISIRDLEDTFGNSTNRTSIVPNGVDLEFWKRSSRQLGRNAIVFTGAMNYRPNSDAAMHLIEEILPRVRHLVPDVHLWIVGRDPRPDLIRAGERSGVTVTGFVEDVRPYLERATVFAAPLRFGAGVQNKVLEAMAMEVPVVASSLAADGLRTEKGQQPPIQTSDDPGRFADTIGKVLVERSRNNLPDAEARCFVASHYVWSRSGEKLDQILNDVANGATVKGEACLQLH